MPKGTPFTDSVCVYRLCLFTGLEGGAGAIEGVSAAISPTNAVSKEQMFSDVLVLNGKNTV
jgi:hypothetical protein